MENTIILKHEQNVSTVIGLETNMVPAPLALTDSFCQTNTFVFVRVCHSIARW